VCVCVLAPRRLPRRTLPKTIQINYNTTILIHVGHGRCRGWDGTCICDEGWTGADCSILTLVTTPPPTRPAPTSSISTTTTPATSSPTAPQTSSSLTLTTPSAMMVHAAFPACSILCTSMRVDGILPLRVRVSEEVRACERESVRARKRGREAERQRT
jgi:hypothetical protein